MFSLDKRPRGRGTPPSRKRFERRRLAKVVPFVDTLEARTLLSGEPLMISEFVASNSTGLRDKFGDASDWVEIYNPSPQPVSLAGWSLTDDASKPHKWNFPAITIGSGAFQVVFASDRNIAIAGQELHTNFKLSADGEYLGLIRPDGSIADSYAPNFPPQRNDVSYGRAIGVTKLVASGASANFLVPQNGNLGDTWTAPGFFGGASWQTRTTGLGYGITQPGFQVRTAKANTFVENIPKAYQVLATSSYQSSVTRSVVPTINFLNTGPSEHFGNDAPFDGIKIGEDTDDFVVEALGTINIPQSGQWSFGVDSDDGFELVLRKGGYQFTMSYLEPRGPSDTIQTFDFPEGGGWDARLVYFERSGWSSLEMFAAQGAHASFDSSFRLVGDTAAGGLPVTTSPLDTTLINSDVRAAMKGVNSSIYIRVPFVVANPSNFDALSLLMNYDDGFVAYINGVRVAADNASTTVAWNSSAVVGLGGIEPLTARTFGINDAISLLKPGLNVLAIQGLNVSANDVDFLIRPELIAIDLDNVQARYFSPPTPGAFNSTAYQGILGDVQFSKSHGLYNAPITVALTSDLPGAVIRYTLDGSTPSQNLGLIYAGPITISTTTVIRAEAFLNNYLPSRLATNTYLFLNDVINQSRDEALADGWPAMWGSNVVDYGMNPDPRYGGDTLIAALQAIPSISITTDLNNLFDPATGIYANAYGQGMPWERPASVELLNPDGSAGFQINAGLRIRGGFSRSGDNPKHAFRLFFRSEYDGDLKYPLFGSEGASVFEKLDLRTDQNYSWSFGGDPRHTAVRDVFSRDTQRDMGDPYTRSRYYHLYIDGQYWGMYQSQERSEAFYGETYLGGKEDDYDVIKVEAGPYQIYATDGNLDAWNRLWQAATDGFASSADFLKMQGKNPDGTDNPNYEVLLDVNNLIDYMLVILYGGNLDAPISAFLGNQAVNNFYAVRDRTGRQGFRFLAHDSEHTLLNVNEDRNGPYPAGEQFQHFNPQWLHQRLLENPEYRLRFADRVQKFFYYDGALTPQRAIDRFLARAAEVAPAIDGESARWGDAKVETPYTRDTWQAAIDDVVQNILPYRTEAVLAQFRNRGMLPATAAPGLLINGATQHGGRVVSGSTLRFDAASGLVYYTLDGSDPRLLGGDINPAALVYDPSTTDTSLIPEGSVWRYWDKGTDPGVTWKNAGFNDNSWSQGPAKLGYGDGDEATVIGYGSDPDNKYITTYFRRTFTVGNPAQFDRLLLKLRRDDGAVIYINGQEVARNNMPSGTITRTTLAPLAVTGDDETSFFEISISPGALVSGTNTIAVEVHQAAANSSDLGFDLAVLGRKATAAGIPITSAAHVAARTLDASGWSAIEQADFQVSDIATSANLAITELQYNPLPPDPAKGELAVDKDEFEFTELRNIGPREISLAGVKFTNGITFDFTNSAVQTLAPGAYVLVVKNVDAFRSRYGQEPLVAGTTGTSNLSNGGERVTLVGPSGTIFDFTYDDEGLWPLSPDGSGPSLVPLSPQGNLNDPANWRASLEIGGSPGRASNTAPALAAPANTTIDEDSSAGPLAFTINDAETPLGALVVTATSDNPTLLPAGTITLGGAAGNRTVLLVPAPNKFGQAQVTLSVDDGNGGVTTRAFVLTVNPVNDPPSGQPDAVIADEDTARIISIADLLANDSDPDSDSLSLVVARQPMHGTLTVNGDGTLTYKGSQDYSGEDSFTYRPSDGTLSGSEVTVTITVRPVNDAPVIAALPKQRGREGQVLSFRVTATDVDSPVDKVRFALAPGAPAGLTIDPITGIVTWAKPVGPLTTTITVTASDDATPKATGQRVFEIEVENAPPVVALQGPTSVTVDAGQEVSLSGRITDPGDDALSATVDFGDGTAPQAVALGADGSFTAHHVYASLGIYSQTITIDDGATIAESVVTITVTPAGDHTGPLVVSVAPKTSKRKFATIVLTFNEALDQKSANSLVNYRLINAGADKKLGTKDDRVVVLKKAAVDRSGKLVTLTPKSPLATNLAYQLTLSGASKGLTDKSGNTLDGDRNGIPGGNYVARFGAKALAKFFRGGR